MQVYQVMFLSNTRCFVISIFSFILTISILLFSCISHVNALVLEQLASEGKLESHFSNKKMGYYLGSFDPLHQGHENVIEACLKNKDCDYVLVYAVWGGDSKKNRANIKIRQQMLDARFKDHPRVIVTHLSAKELQSMLTIPIPNKTFNNKAVTQPAFPGTQFIGVIGADTAYYPDQKAFWYYMRGLKIAEENAKDTLGAIVAIPVEGFILAEREGYDIAALKGRVVDRPIISTIKDESTQAISSTMIKKNIIQQESISELVSSQILRIIQKFDLYRWGERGDTIDLSVHDIQEPPLSHSKKSFVTQNKYGFDVLQAEQNWVMESFLSKIGPGKTVLDVGSGYGTLSRAALKLGATVVSNDISYEHLLYNFKHLEKTEMERFYLSAKDIREAEYPKASFDSIMFHRVLHFFKGDEITAVLKKSYSWLKPGGRIFIVMMSKDHIAFRDKIHYDDKKVWPGEELIIVEKHLPEQAYALPKTLHVVSKETLIANIEKLGFVVEKSDYVSLKKVGNEKDRDGREAVGIVAIKK